MTATPRSSASSRARRRSSSASATAAAPVAARSRPTPPHPPPRGAAARHCRGRLRRHLDGRLQELRADAVVLARGLAEHLGVARGELVALRAHELKLLFDA